MLFGVSGLLLLLLLQVQPAAETKLGRPPKLRPQQKGQQAGPQQECTDVEVEA